MAHAHTHKHSRTHPHPPHTPHTQFGTGSLQTLLYEPKAQGIDTREALIQFHEKARKGGTDECCLPVCCA